MKSKLVRCLRDKSWWRQPRFFVTSILVSSQKQLRFRAGKRSDVKTDSCSLIELVPNIEAVSYYTAKAQNMASPSS